MTDPYKTAVYRAISQVYGLLETEKFHFDFFDQETREGKLITNTFDSINDNEHCILTPHSPNSKRWMYTFCHFDILKNPACFNLLTDDKSYFQFRIRYFQKVWRKIERQIFKNIKNMSKSSFDHTTKDTLFYVCQNLLNLAIFFSLPLPPFQSSVTGLNGIEAKQEPEEAVDILINFKPKFNTFVQSDIILELVGRFQITLQDLTKISINRPQCRYYEEVEGNLDFIFDTWYFNSMLTLLRAWFPSLELRHGTIFNEGGFLFSPELCFVREMDGINHYIPFLFVNKAHLTLLHDSYRNHMDEVLNARYITLVNELILLILRGGGTLGVLMDNKCALTIELILENRVDAKDIRGSRMTETSITVDCLCLDNELGVYNIQTVLTSYFYHYLGRVNRCHKDGALKALSQLEYCTSEFSNSTQFSRLQ